MTHESQAFILCGLGNPGQQYAGTRHNLGFMLVDYLRSRCSFPDFLPKFSGAFSSIRLPSVALHLFKPMTFMNNSGVPLARLVNFYKVDVNNVFIFHDDIDLDFAKVRIKRGGGSGGHNGLKSLDANIGNDYWRFRFGVGRDDEQDPVRYVLSHFGVPELAELNKLFGFIADNIIALLQDVEGRKDVFLREYNALSERK